MTDITSDSASGPAPVALQVLQSNPAQAPARARDRGRAADLVACVELLFFAYRDFTGDPDAVLEEYGFGRAHHRVLHFVHRNPGLRVAELARHPEDHQAEPGARPEAAHR